MGIAPWCGTAVTTGESIHPNGHAHGFCRSIELGRGGPEAPPAEETAEDFSAEIATAIGLALHQHLVAQRVAMVIGAGTPAGAVSWSSSGRIEIMNARQRVTSRGH